MIIQHLNNHLMNLQHHKSTTATTTFSYNTGSTATPRKGINPTAAPEHILFHRLYNSQFRNNNKTIINCLIAKRDAICLQGGVWDILAKRDKNPSILIYPLTIPQCSNHKQNNNSFVLCKTYAKHKISIHIQMNIDPYQLKQQQRKKRRKVTSTGNHYQPADESDSKFLLLW